MRRNIFVLEYLEQLNSLYEELQEYRDFGFPLPRRHFYYYKNLLRQISEIKSYITEITD